MSLGFLDEVIAFLEREASAKTFPTDHGVRITWDGTFYDHLWREGGWLRYGTSERAMSRVEELGSADEAIVANWFMYLAMNIVRQDRSFPIVMIRPGAFDFRPGWSVEELGTMTGRLVRPDGVPLEMVMETVAPVHSDLLALSWFVDADPRELWDSLLEPDGKPLLTQLVERP